VTPNQNTKKKRPKAKKKFFSFYESLKIDPKGTF
jgi:hypothetical protein